MNYENNKINGNLCIKLLNECINDSSDTYQKEWSKLNWSNDIDWETMNYEDALNIAKKVGLDKNSVEIVVSELNNKYNKTLSNSVIIVFQAIKNRISKNNLMKGGNYSIYLLKNIFIKLQKLLKNKNKKINENDLNRIYTFIKNKELIDKKYHILINNIDQLNNLLDEDKILISNNITELTLKDIKNLVDNNTINVSL